MDIRSVILSVALASLASSAAAQQISDDELFRWVDDDGNVHYTNTLPAEYSDRPYDIINSDGIVVRRVTDPLNPDGDENLPPVIDEEERQRRSDRMLMVKYRSEQDLIDTMESDIGQLDYDRRMLLSGRESLAQAYRGQIRKAADIERAGNTVTEEVLRDVRDIRRRLVANENQLRAIDEREMRMREEFEAQLARYRYLNGSSSGS